MFEKHFPKIIYKGRIGFSKGWMKHGGEEKIPSYMS
jgi:hypothetical protein